MGWLIWLLGIAIGCLLYQAFESRKARAENTTLRRENGELRKRTEEFQQAAVAAMAAAAYITASQGGRVEIPDWAGRTGWQVSYRKLESGGLVFEAEERVQ